MVFFHRYIQLYLIVNYLPHLCHLLIIQKHIFFPISLLFTNAYSRKYAKTLVHIYMYTSRDATYRFRTSNNAKSNPEIKGCNSIFFRHWSPKEENESSTLFFFKKWASYRLYRKRPPRIVNRTIPKIIAILVHAVNCFPLSYFPFKSILFAFQIQKHMKLLVFCNLRLE